jgi:hypothetical protein
LDVFHNLKIDGKERAKPAGFLRYYDINSRHTLPTAVGVCPIKAAN